jgi:hypothetical protein
VATKGYSADHAGLEVVEHRAWYVFAARGLVVKHVDAVELRVVVAAVFAVAAEAVLVAQYLLKLGLSSGYLTGPPACAQFRAKKQPGGGEHAGEKGRGGAKKLNKHRVVLWQGNRKCRWHARVYPERETEVILPLEHPESTRCENIELQKCAVIAIYLVRACS